MQVHLRRTCITCDVHCIGVSAEAAARHAAAFACLHYRKPKRIRTAFSPTQLVRLEEAFDSNQYVVGQERKDLAASLSLTETQVHDQFC